MSTETEKPICGIIIPISQSDDGHTEAHWIEAKRVFEAAIAKAGLTPQAVWLDPASDIIQAKILKNLFENEIILCDVSTRNPNVMLELGMRLTTKRPTVIVAEQGTRLPFDTSVIHVEFYDPELQWSSVEGFIQTVAETLRTTYGHFKDKKYKSYLEAFTFETVRPATVSVTADEAIERRLDELLAKVSRLEQAASATDRNRSADAISETLAGLMTPRTSERIEIFPGMRVFTQDSGLGTVTGRFGHMYRIDFDKAGSRSYSRDALTVLP